MRRNVLFVLVAVATAAARPTIALESLSFEARVAAQAAIERVYHAHQIGATSRFDEAVPRAALDAKVRRYLQESLALERYWDSPITAAMLARELERMAQQTQLPDRLRELFAALDDDLLLVQECLVRPALSARLAREHFAFDRGIHAASLAQAEALRDALTGGLLDPRAEHPNRQLIELVRGDDSVAFDARRADLAAGVGRVIEERDAFAVEALLEQSPDRLLVARYSIGKRLWEDWWSAVATELDPRDLEPIHPVARALPGVHTVGCGEGPWIPGALFQAPFVGPLDTLTQRTPGVWTGSLFLVYSGGTHESGGRYDPATHSWSRMAAGGPNDRHNHTAVWTGERMIVWGGEESCSSTTCNHPTTGGRYDPLLDSWATMSTQNVPIGRQGHTAIWTGSEMIVWGGVVDSAGVDNYLSTGGRYNPTTNSWVSFVSVVNAPSERTAHTAVWTGSEMIVWGGLVQPLGDTDITYLASGGRYNPTTNSWAALFPSANVPSARAAHTAVWTGDRMFVWGGESSVKTDTGGSYDPDTNAWSHMSVNGATPEARSRHTAVWTGTQMLVWGGSGSSELSSGGRYDPSRDSWEPMTLTGAPAAREQHAAVWTGSEMIVWGGTVSATLLDTGGRYDPSADSWVPIVGVERRASHEQVWTGNVMIVWGGWTRTGSWTNSGARFDPALDTWTPTSLAAAPSPREKSQSVWTGTEMLVWGGDNGSALGDGARYDPSTDTWSPIRNDSATPTPRSLHRAIWTGSEMIVWGGTPTTDTGARYDPVSDAWTPVSTTGAPSARFGHSAVWTGSRMVIWGGFDAGNTGGRYDPDTDTWSTTATAEAPSGRSYHTAVWTGSEMIVWGGNINQSTGGRYDPVGDVWIEAISTVGAPSPRMNHTAIWTDHEMIVWGGHNTSNLYHANGGAYNYLTDTWLAVSTQAAPTARSDHRAIWIVDVDNMIVWGGRNSEGAYASGAAYRRNTDNDHDGFTNCQGDCRDDDAAIHPDAVELCDGTDNDCNDAVDEGFPVPGRVLGLRFSSKANLAWDVEPVADRYDLLRGDLTSLLSGEGDFSVADVACIEDDSVDAAGVDLSSPDPGSALFFLSRAQRDCKSGTYEGGGTTEQPGRDEEIAAAAAACP